MSGGVPGSAGISSIRNKSKCRIRLRTKGPEPVVNAGLRLRRIQGGRDNPVKGQLQGPHRQYPLSQRGRTNPAGLPLCLSLSATLSRCRRPSGVDCPDCLDPHVARSRRTGSTPRHHGVVYITSRKQKRREETESWLKQYGFPRADHVLYEEDIPGGKPLALNQRGAFALVDDMPRTLEAAVAAGLTGYWHNIPKNGHMAPAASHPGLHPWQAWRELDLMVRLHVRAR